MSTIEAPFPDSPEQTEVWNSHGPRNYRLGVVNGILFILAESLMDPTLVLVAFVSHLTQSPILIGLVVPIRDAAWSLPQLWVSSFLQSMPDKMRLYRQMTWARVALWGLIAATINFVRPAWLQLALFFAVFFTANLVSGIAGLPFLEVVSKTIPPRRRGEFFALRFGLGGLLGIGGSLFVRWMLDPANPIPFPGNFGLLSFLYFVIASVSLISYSQVVEPLDPVVLPRTSLGAQARRAWKLLSGDASFRRFLTMQSSLLLAGMATPFFAVHVQRQLGGPPEMVGVYLAITMTTGLLSNALFGRVSLRAGNRRVVYLASLIGLSMSALALVLALAAGPLGLRGQAASYFLIPVFILSGMRNTAMGVSSNSLLMELAPAGQRSVYLGFIQTLLGLVMLSTSLSGIIFSAAGFTGLVLVTLLAHLAALWSAVRITRAAAHEAGA